MSDREKQTTEHDSSPEQHLATITTLAQEILNELAIEPVVQEDGSTERILCPGEVTSSRYTAARLTETAPPANGPKKYVYQYVLYDRPMDIQVLEWDEKGSVITHGVKFAFSRPEEDIQIVKTIEPTDADEKLLESHLRTLEGGYRNDMITAARAKEGQLSTRETRIQNALKRVAFGKY